VSATALVLAQATELLKALGGTSLAVAANLYHLGFTGVPKRSHFCPVAYYLHDALDCSVEVSVNEVSLSAIFTGDRSTRYVHTTDAVASFVTEFDEGLYPQLIAGNRRVTR
jgi:hypothetical protein